MYRLLHGGEVIWHPYDDIQVADIVLDDELNGAGKLKVEIPPNHPWASTVDVMDGEVVLDRDGEEEFRGRAIRVEKDIQGNVSIECEGQRAYMNDILLRPYDTSSGLGGASPRADELFAWYVSCYNRECSRDRSFTVGINEAAELDANNYLYRASTNDAVVWTELKTKMVESIGGFVRARYEGGKRYLDYLAKAPRTSRQPIEIGVNLTDFASKVDATKLYTAVLARGKDNLEISVNATLADHGRAEYEAKRGIVYDTEAVKRYGVIVKSVRSESETEEGLIRAAIAALDELSLSQTYTLDAFDMSLIDPTRDRWRVGELIGVWAPRQGVDRAIICTSRHIEPLRPSAAKYVLGDEEERLSGRVSGKQDAIGSNGDVSAIPTAFIDSL